MAAVCSIEDDGLIGMDSDVDDVTRLDDADVGYGSKRTDGRRGASGK